MQGIWEAFGRQRRRLAPNALIHKSAQQQGADYLAQLPQPPNWWQRGAS